MSGIANEPRLRERIAESLPEVTVDEAWSMVLLIRHARRYCRSNARFKTVSKTNAKGAVGKTRTSPDSAGQCPDHARH